MESSYKFPTVNVLQHAVGTTPLAIILARKPVMMDNGVHYARNLAKSTALTLDATRDALSRAHPVSRIAPGRARIAEVAGWPVQCPSVCGEVCPSARYCQECAQESIKELVVDYILQSTYAEIDLNVDPVIVPPCGHLLTIESMDGHMQMSAFFELSPTNPVEILGLKNSSKPFEAGDLKGCPLCRMPLRSISRYGRIVRRAFIDEATKKFIVWANSTFVPLAGQLRAIEEKLAATTGEYETIARPPHGSITKLSVPLKGEPQFQIARVRTFIGKQRRYADLFRLRQIIRDFHKRVAESEQPFSRIYDLVQDARLRRGIIVDFDYTPEILQTRNRFLATALLLRCDYLILLEFLEICKNGRAAQALGSAPALDVDFTNNREICYNLLAECVEKRQWASVVEGQLFWARFTALERGVTEKSEHTAALLTEARNHLKNARWMCHEYPGQTKGLLDEVDTVERMLNEGTFYATVTNEEKAAVYAAMASEFSGTGHWYYCENNHPFTVGECGMPMQTSVCPQCGAAVGGQSHQSVAGVVRATDIESQFGRLAI
ncbi:MAG: hypothetical protein HETSPECPRED_007476 [Heterodermia speciosa]|uniref:RZ-type domain-containing protein n=1 Tax=Heterodermia speciosa TaxID=116794 RepID=A0A8H3FRM2_9LECA|nr:MAG: hypothetical protein HETSPECPRED_007476 [Heterodermia speciosa]